MFLQEVFNLYKTSFSILAIFLSAFLLLLFDNDPPGLPMRSEKFTPDCYQIEPISLFVNKSTINVSLKLGDFVEFPKSAAIRLIKVSVLSAESFTDFYYGNFLNVFVNDSYMSFSVLQPIAGQLHISVKCQNRLLNETLTNIDEIDEYVVGQTRALSLPHLSAQFDDFCYSNNSIAYFTDAITGFSPLKAAYNESINISSNLLSYEIYKSGKDIEIIDNPTLFITSKAKDVWMQLIDIFIPMWASLFSLYDNKTELNVDTFLTRDQEWLIPNLERMTHTILKNDTEYCFSTGYFIRSMGSSPIGVNSPFKKRTLNKQNISDSDITDSLSAHLSWIMKINPNTMHDFKDSFIDKEVKNKSFAAGRNKTKVILDQGTMLLKSMLLENFDDLEITEIPDINSTGLISNIANEVYSADIFIGSSITSLVFAVFLSENSTLIELKPKGCECINIGEPFANMANAKYIPLRNSKHCKVNTISKYLNMSRFDYENILPQEIKSAFQKALS